MDPANTGVRRIAIVGAGISGLGAAWGLSHHPDRFDFRIFEARSEVGGNAVTADMPQDDGSFVPFDISVTALIPSVYQHVLLLMERFGIDMLETRFSYSVKYGDGTYAHDFDSDLRQELATDIAKFQRLLRRLHRFGTIDPFPLATPQCTEPVQLRQHGASAQAGQVLPMTSSTRSSSLCS